VSKPAPVRLYFNGPLRLFSTERFQGAVPYAAGDLKGFAGAFLCELCRFECHRVLWFESAWLCRDCRSAALRQRASMGAFDQ
jgi:hypothetical protein